MVTVEFAAELLLSDHKFTDDKIIHSNTKCKLFNIFISAILDLPHAKQSRIDNRTGGKNIITALRA